MEPYQIPTRPHPHISALQDSTLAGHGGVGQGEGAGRAEKGLLSTGITIDPRTQVQRRTSSHRVWLALGPFRIPTPPMCCGPARTRVVALVWWGRVEIPTL